ncbi:30S ribosomal protein S8 [Patescibacteria group bacterium]|nr:30S ribosomal protein S8 [Patescibacteria group bacterium]
MTYVTDPIGDLLTRIRNAQSARHNHCQAPWSRTKEQLCELLRDNDWIADVTVSGEDPKKIMTVTFNPKKPKLELSRISKPGRRVYKGTQELRPILHGYGTAILTTSQGLMTDKEARKKKIGGEVLCTIA